MHRLRSLRYAACHFLFNILLFCAGIGLLAAGLITSVVDWQWIGASILLAWALSCAVFFLYSLTWHCPLCMGKLWVNTGCRRHRNASSTLGISYRLHIALSVLFKKQYRCTYCGEPFSTRKAHR